MRNCFIPMCDAKCRDWTKRMMFMAPKDDAMFQQWLDHLPQQRRPFRKTDRICERHFDKKDIITTWDHIINGEVHKLERTKPKLKPDAIPTQNLEYVPPGNLLCRKTKDKLKSPNAKKMKVKENGVTSVLAIYKDSGTENGNPNQVSIQTDASPRENTNIATVETGNVVVLEEETIPEATLQKFESLFDDVFEVSLPSTLWGWHRDVNRKYICVCQFSIDLLGTSKMIVISNNMVARTFLLDKEIAQTVLEDSDPDNLAAIIDNIDKLKLCPGTMGPDREKCMYMVEDVEQTRCSVCRTTAEVKASGSVL